MASRRIRWLISISWIAIALLTFVVVDASSFRSWLYLMTVALVPPIVLIGENEFFALLRVVSARRT